MSLGTGCYSWTLKQAELLLSRGATNQFLRLPQNRSPPPNGLQGPVPFVLWEAVAAVLSYVGAGQPCPLWVADTTSLGDLSLSCGPRFGQHQCPLLRIFRPGATLAALVLPRSHFQTRESCCALDTSECTCCVPDTHQVRRVSFSLKGRLVWPKHPNSGFTSNKTGFQKLKTGPNR